MGTLTKTAAQAILADDRRLVNEAVVAIRTLCDRGLLATVVGVGDYLIDVFFDGSLELALSHAPTKPAALGSLLERARELPISVHQLRLAIRISVQYRSLPPEIVDQLSVRHHELLLLVSDGETKEQLARAAVAKKLSARELEKRVRKHRPRHPGGRPAALASLRWARSLARAVDTDALAEIAGDDELGKMSVDDIRALGAVVRQARERLQGVLDACERQVKRLGPAR